MYSNYQPLPTDFDRVVGRSVKFRLLHSTSWLLDHLDAIKQVLKLSLLDLQSCRVTLCDRDSEGSLVQSLIKETQS